MTSPLIGRQSGCKRSWMACPKLASTPPISTAGRRTGVYDPGRQKALPNKSQTSSVEADNSELRHYLARLGRRSRCITRSRRALREAIKLFVYAWNRRQLTRLAHPQYWYDIRNFVYP